MACKIDVEDCVHGYHTYQDVWDTAVGEELWCQREPNNVHDSYAVAVVKDEHAVGHVQERIS